jgi:predicted DsbA family dithiol-disulfide isomerase
VLERRTFRTAVDADWEASRRLGVTGVPTFVAGRYGVVGAQPYEVLEELVRRAASEG